MTNPRPPKRQRTSSSAPPLPDTVNGFHVLPIRIASPVPSTPSAVHVLFVRKHEEAVRPPAVSSTDPSRTLFIVNIPVDSTKEALRGLFASLGARLEDVRIHRQTENDLEEENLDEYVFPDVWDKSLCQSGSTAHITFPDPEDVTKILKTISKERRNQSGAIREWGVGIENPSSTLGLNRTQPPHEPPLIDIGYLTHYKLTYPAKPSLQSLVDTALTRFNAVEAARMLTLKRLRSEPDEDGFITVTRKQREDVIIPPAEKRRNKAIDLEDFYKFQRREKREKQMDELRRKFEEDKIKVERAKQARKFKPF
jgi:ribosomal RNA-processing protein 7